MLTLNLGYKGKSNEIHFRERIDGEQIIAQHKKPHHNAYFPVVFRYEEHGNIDPFQNEVASVQQYTGQYKKQVPATHPRVRGTEEYQHRHENDTKENVNNPGGFILY